MARQIQLLDRQHSRVRSFAPVWSSESRGKRMRLLSIGLQRLAVGLLSVCLVSSACTSTRAVSLSRVTASDPGLSPGRDAEIVLRSGAKISAWIVEVSESGLNVRSAASPAPYFIAFSDIQSLHVRQPAKGRTLGISIGGAIVVAVGIFYLLLLHRAKSEGNVS
jgi:hypothetical protein